MLITYNIIKDGHSIKIQIVIYYNEEKFACRIISLNCNIKKVLFCRIHSFYCGI